MTGRQRLATTLIGVAGVAASLVALAGFLLRVMGNRLESPTSPTLPAFYHAVGAAYADGFIAGFALAFFLTLLAIAAGTWLESRRDGARQPTN